MSQASEELDEIKFKIFRASVGRDYSAESPMRSEPMSAVAAEAWQKVIEAEI